MKNYPANQRWGTHVVKLKWQIDDFKAEGIMEIGGNCKGGSILSNAVVSIEDGDFEPRMTYEENKKHFIVDEDGYLSGIRLFDVLGAETSFDADFFEEFLVGVEIIEFKKEDD